MLREGNYKYGEKTRMNTKVLDQNWRYQLVWMCTFQHRNKCRHVCVCTHIYIFPHSVHWEGLRIITPIVISIPTSASKFHFPLKGTRACREIIDPRDGLQKVQDEGWNIWYQKARKCLKDNADISKDMETNLNKTPLSKSGTIWTSKLIIQLTNY